LKNEKKKRLNNELREKIIIDKRNSTMNVVNFIFKEQYQTNEALDLIKKDLELKLDCQQELLMDYVINLFTYESKIDKRSPSYKIQLETFINETEQKVNAFDPTCMDLSFYLDPEVAPNEKELEQLHLKIKNLEEEVSVKNRFTGCSVCYSFDAS
jgi:hypothetical protein